MGQKQVQVLAPVWEKGYQNEEKEASGCKMEGVK